MFKNFQFEVYNKLWVSLLPMAAYFINKYAGTELSAADLQNWSEDAMLLLSPILVWLVANKPKA